MKYLTVIDKDKDDHYLNDLYEVAGHIDNSAMLQVSSLSADILINKQIDVVISNGLSKEWYYLFRGMRVVSITFGDWESYHNLADIVIDYQADKPHSFSEVSSLKRPLRLTTVKEVIGLVDLLKWDSEFFGFPIAYLSSRYLTDNIVGIVNTFVKEHRVRLVEYLCQCHDRNSVLCAEKYGFRFVDIRLTLEHNINRLNDISILEGGFCAQAQEPHVPQLKEIARNAYVDSRYYFDGNFPLDKVHAFYEGWVEKAVFGTFDTHCYAMFNSEKMPIAFCSIRVHDSETATIGLFGVDKNYRGRGIGIQLLAWVKNVLYVQGYQKLAVVTQGRNYSAQRLYQRSGFITKSTELWYHKWS